MKRPAFQWYPGDFRRDTGVQACTFEARGLWREMLDLMHDGEPRGFLNAGGAPITPDALARIVGVPVAKVTRWLKELEDRRVFSRTDEGVIYSRRMVRDEEARLYSAKCGDASTRPPSGRRMGKTGALFNFLIEKWRGCLWCDTTTALELHRIIPGRRGGLYEPGNVLLLCHEHHEDAGAAELTIGAILQRHNMRHPRDFFAGFSDPRFTGLDTPSDTPSDTPTNTRRRTREIPSAVAVASAGTTTPVVPVNGDEADRFEEFWAVYPRRSGTNPKHGAETQWRRRLRDGATADEIIAGAQRYRELMETTAKIGTEYVMQAVRFLGKDKHFEDEHAPPPAETNGDRRGHSPTGEGRALSASERMAW